MRITQVFLGVALVSLAQAWRFSLQDILMSEPFIFLRSALQNKGWPARRTPSVHQAKPAPVSCVFKNLENLAACACFVAQSESELKKGDIIFCRSLLGLSFAEQRRRCDGFRDSNGDVQVYRLIHNVFNILETCTVEKVVRETEAQETQKPSRSPSKKTPRPTTGKPTRTPVKTPSRPSTRPSNSTSPLPGEPSNKPTRPTIPGPKSGTWSPGDPSMTPTVMPTSSSDSTVTPQNAAMETARAASSHVPSQSWLPVVDSSQVDQLYSSRYELQTSVKVPFSRKAIWGYFEVLKKIGKILVRIFRPFPSGKDRVGYLSRRYEIICTFPGKKSMRMEIGQKAVRLLLYNDIDVVLPLVEEENIPGVQRMKSRVGVVRCRKVPRKPRFKCVCFKKKPKSKKGKGKGREY